MTPPLLRLPNFTKPFMVESDTCGEGIGAILILQGRSVDYFSEALKRSYLSLFVYEDEML